LRNLTGAPGEDFEHKDVEKTWDFLIEGKNRGYLLTGSS